MRNVLLPLCLWGLLHCTMAAQAPQPSDFESVGSITAQGVGLRAHFVDCEGYEPSAPLQLNAHHLGLDLVFRFELNLDAQGEPVYRADNLPLGEYHILGFTSGYRRWVRITATQAHPQVLLRAEEFVPVPCRVEIPSSVPQPFGGLHFTGVLQVQADSTAFPDGMRYLRHGVVFTSPYGGLGIVHAKTTQTTLLMTRGATVKAWTNHRTWYAETTYTVPQRGQGQPRGVFRWRWDPERSSTRAGPLQKREPPSHASSASP